jgi:NlpC/P60 family putative phage cell wall peptidase
MTRSEIAAAARAWLGTPYHHQASAKGIGCDCLGLVRGVWRELFGDEPELVPPYTPDWAEAQGVEMLLEGAARHFLPGTVRKGALLVFRWKAGVPAKHVGIAVGEGRFVHAYDGAGRVVEGALGTVWGRKLAGAFDFPGVTD